MYSITNVGHIRVRPRGEFSQERFSFYGAFYGTIFQVNPPNRYYASCIQLLNEILSARIKWAGWFVRITSVILQHESKSGLELSLAFRGRQARYKRNQTKLGKKPPFNATRASLRTSSESTRILATSKKFSDRFCHS